jgi:hypothetical protein
MRRRSLALIAVLAALATAVAAAADDGTPINRGSSNPLTLAVIGDVPYTEAQVAAFPGWVDAINGDPKVDVAVHLGDIKSGSTRCDDAYFATIAGFFDRFRAPLVYTPGDNEWTDCHRPNNGAYDPLERLSKLREVFFAEPGETLGRREKRVIAQPGYPENVLWLESKTVFAAVHVVGSNNSLAPWTGMSAPTEAQLAEANARIRAALAWVDRAFRTAADHDARGVVLMMQADTFAGSNETLAGFVDILERIEGRAASYRGHVLLLQGDTHAYLEDVPLAGAPNLTRIVVEGAETGDEWLKLTVHPRAPELFSWERVVFPTPDDGGPKLLGRAILPSDAYQPGPPSGSAVAPNNGVTPPFPGQPIPGFSAVLDAGHGELWGMPDNGYGAKTNSADFLLRLYRIRPNFETARGGAGTVEILGFLQLRDPDGRIPFPLTRPDRLLTGADFDLESVRRVKDGTFWFGEEFGPFLLHTDATGEVLEAPVPLPGVQSPQNPFLGSGTPNLPASRGFEPLALSEDGRTLYPMLEGALVGDPDPRRRIVYEFDLRSGSYTGQTWSYRTDAAFPNAVIGDLTALDRHRFVLIERDDFQGEEAQQKKIYLIDLRRTDADGYLEKQLVLDLLEIADPAGISLPARPGEFGVGDPFSFPLQSVESLEVLGGERLLIANDNNYPGSDGRWIARDRPDDTELIVVRVPALR